MNGHSTTAPADYPPLRRFFTESEAEFGFASNMQGILNMGVSGVSNFGSSVKTDDRLVYRGTVGVHNERSSAGNNRRMLDAMRSLDPWHATILWLAYGDESAVPALALPDNPQARQKLGQHLGGWRNVLIATETAQRAHAWSVVIDARTNGKRWLVGDEVRMHSLPLWLLNHAPAWVLRDVKREAYVLVNEAWSAWCVVAPRVVKSARSLNASGTWERVAFDATGTDGDA